MLIKINKSNLILLEKLLKDNDIKYELYPNLYKALAYEEAQVALDHTIENEDMYITKEDYEKSLRELADDIYNNDEDIMQDFTNLSRDLAEDILTKRKILVV